jgi:hypothetical protein
MIIFDLDGTLADCEHRRHFVDPEKNINYLNEVHSVELVIAFECDEPSPKPRYFHKITGEKFKPDWRAFYEACDKDVLIKPVAEIWNNYEDEIYLNISNIYIWSGRCESVRKKTIQWLEDNLFRIGYGCWDSILKMRPIGDSTPDEVLKEKWLDEALEQGKTIKMVFDDRPKVVKMWRRRGIFVFDCNQKGKEF